ncbi:DUF5677 domain-containing protein [Methylophaga sp.]|uniref:DUF5677 domain-containing protein n=1 Tax=Methylophaga sp. TaxID=2024840 RepID=UPI003A8E3FAB
MTSKHPLEILTESYSDYLVESFNKLWEEVNIEHDKLEAYSVIGGLLSRQVTLSLEMAGAPRILNGNSAPLFLRAMTDLHIALSWIMLDLEERSKKYILHGLGEEKLLMEHYKNEIENHPDHPDIERIEQLIKVKSAWINAQRRDFSVEVNLGNWSQLDYRRMSQEADCESLYKFAYKPFSHAAHNMWPYVSVYNCKDCENPLHKHHLIPELFEPRIDIDYLFRSCKYVHMAYEEFINKFSLELNFPLPMEWWYEFFEENQDIFEKEDK